MIQTPSNPDEFKDQLALLAYIEKADTYKALRATTSLAKTADFLRAVFIPGTPSHRLSLSDLDSWHCSTFAKEIKGWREIDLLTDIAESELLHRGYRPERDLMTVQEHKLIGSTFQRPEFLLRPHVPIGILTGALYLEETAKARELQRITHSFGPHYNEKTYLIDVRYEGLDAKGETVCDPRRVNAAFETIPTTYSANFPFRRPERDHAPLPQP